MFFYFQFQLHPTSCSDSDQLWDVQQSKRKLLPRNSAVLSSEEEGSNIEAIQYQPKRVS